jgi:phage-related protein
MVGTSGSGGIARIVGFVTSMGNVMDEIHIVTKQSQMTPARQQELDIAG